MPLLDEDLDKRFVQVEKDETVGSALAKLQAQGGDDDWLICVTGDPSTVGVVGAGAMKGWLERMGPPLFELRFADLWNRLSQARAVQQEAVGIGAAERLALRSPGGVLVVLRGEEVAGCVRVTVKRGDETFPGSSMAQLYGEYISQAPDQRAKWQPSGVEPPVCPHCGHRGFYRYDATDGSFRCAECGQTIPG